MTITTQTDAWGGNYYVVHTNTFQPQHALAIERIDDLDRFVCSYREEPFFMSATAGGSVNDIPKETQWLGVRHADGTYSVYFSMAFETYRTALYGQEGQLWVAALTGDDAVSRDDFCAFYKISGTDFYELVQTGAQSLAQRYGCILRKQKIVPEFLDWFGWCTWDSFYDQVQAEDIPKGLESFRKGGVVPKFLILDDGWQTTGDKEKARGEWKLSDFCANEKFGHSLAETVSTAKGQYGVEKFFVWHAILGCWGGIDPKSEKMKKYGPVLSKAVHTDGIRELNPARWESEHFDFGMIDPAKAMEFYEDYHAWLENQGVDGVKIDVQASLEGHAQGRGGRIALTRTIRQGMENSVERHFSGEMINCMSCANDIIYHCGKTNMMRSSNDFFPEDPKSHSLHIYRNAVNSIWMSPFTLCDWDMFQTSHAYGPYHAASRAISGGPVYVSDRVDAHDFGLIRALTDSEGKILRPTDVAMPTLDCLFRDPRADQSLYKIFNKNIHNAVVGVFSFEGEERSIAVSPSDVPGNETGLYALYSYQTGKAVARNAGETVDVTLRSGEFDVITIVNLRDGFGVIGITDKLNSGGGVRDLKCNASTWQMWAADGGKLLFYCDKPVRSVTLNGAPVEFTEDRNFVTAVLPTAGLVSVTI